MSISRSGLALPQAVCCGKHGLFCISHHSVAGSLRVLAGKETVDIGLLVKNAKGPVCVPDYARPAEGGSGWQYSPALENVLRQYKVSLRRLRFGLLAWSHYDAQDSR